MLRTQHRLLPILATGLAALAFGAAPALAGSDGCSGGDCQDENTPASVVPVPPAPVTAPLSSPPPATPVADTTCRTRHVVSGTRTVAQRTVPRGAVAAGAGGTAPEAPGIALLGLAGGLGLLAAGGGVLAGRASHRLMTQSAWEPRRRAGRRLSTLLGLAALIAGVALLAAVVGAFAVSRCGDGGGEAQSGRLALQLDAVTDHPYVSPPSWRTASSGWRRRSGSRSPPSASARRSSGSA